MASQRRRLYRAMTTVALPGAAFGLLAALPLTPAKAQAVGADLKVLSPHAGDALGANAFSLDVSFRSRSNSPVTTAELWVDGTRWVRRDLDAPQLRNVLSFAVDASSISEGSHTFLVRVFTASGAVAETSLSVVAGSNAGVVVTAPNAPNLNFQTPGNGKRVLGQVELLIDSPAKNGLNPYITIYVDKQFKTLKNFPPYSYSWDTTAVSNGMHTIEATGYLESSNQSTTRKIRVFVDNPGGNTDVKHDIPDLSAHGAAVSPAHNVALTLPAHAAVIAHHAAHAVAHVAVPALHLTPAADTALAPVGAPVVSTPHAVTAYVTAEPAGVVPLGEHVSTVSAASALAFKAPSADTIRQAAPVVLASRAHTMALVEKGAVASQTAAVSHPRRAAFAQPVVESVSASALAAITVAPVATSAAPTVAIRPIAPAMSALSAPGFLARNAWAHSVPAPMSIVTSPQHPAAAIRQVAGGAILTAAGSASFSSGMSAVTSLPSPSHGLPISVRTAAKPRISRSGHRVALRPGAHGLLQMHGHRGLEVAFNGTQIAFDVQPRVEAGLPIAPFRQIFEHTGGQVDWVEKTQVVHAINAEREIVITVGKSSALVNGQNVSMERSAFVERGRTIVPLSFVGTALNVNVKYDQATGKLQITSK
jgi:hypothetical protein